MPLIEGHSDTRERFSWNPFTYSDVRSFRGGGKPPSCEILFKGGEKLQEDLRRFVKMKGWHHWMTIQTSESGSYNEINIIDFLESHLEKGPADRPWRILLVDDFGPHKTDAVRRLAWRRKYIVIVHGGGATSVAQTNDTDQNQHVRRIYTEEESHVLLHKSATLAQKVPVLDHEQTIRIFGEIWQRDDVHCKARDGYTKTGATVPLEGDDREICREAAIFWKERHMGDKRHEIIGAVRHQHQAGRLPWGYGTIYSEAFMTPYPKRGCMDETLAGQFDAGWDMDDKPWSDDGAGHGDGDANADGNDGDGADGGTGDHGDGHAKIAAAVSAVVVSDAASALGQTHHDTMQNLHEQRQHCVKMGLVGVLVAVDDAIHKEVKRMKGVRATHPAVVTAMMQRQVAERGLLAKQRADIAALNAHKQTIADMQRQAKHSKEALAAIKAEIKQAKRDYDNIYAIKTFSLEDFGYGKTSKTDLKKAKKLRHEVLDKLSLTGAGLSAEQTRDFDWFKTNWDNVNETFEDDWPTKFAELTQGVQDDITKKGDTTAFSKFMHAETLRCLQGIPRLRI